MLRNLGTISANPVVFGGGGGIPNAVKITDSAVASGQAALSSELQKRDPLLREPLTSVTYPRDIPIVTGGGWVDTLSAMYVQYGISEGSGDGVVAASGANGSKVIQASVSEEKWGTHVFDVTMRIGYIDLQRSKITGRSLDQMLTEGVRLTYDKHMDQNTYIGMPKLNTYGIVNHPDVTARLVDNGSVSGTRPWAGKTADEILHDFNKAIITVWNRAENSLDALPNHVLMPHEQYNHIATTKVSQAADKTILTFIEENNIVRKNQGADLFIGATNFCAGAGTGGSDRMVVYVHQEKYLKMEELVSLHRAMTNTNATFHSYDSLYLANISEVELLYTETIGYFDGI